MVIPGIMSFDPWSSAEFFGFATVIGFCVAYSCKICVQQKFFKKQGIVTPKDCRFVSGHYHQIIKNNYSDQLRSWSRECGSKTYGFYEGHLPVLVTSDVDIIKQVFVDQFESFTARKKSPIQFSDRLQVGNIGVSSRGCWMRMRRIIDPAFSVENIQQIFDQMNMSSNRFVEEIEKNLDRSLDMQRYFSKVTLDIIFNCAFGFDVENGKDLQKSFYANTAILFENLTKYKMAVLLCMYFYELKPVIVGSVQLLTLLLGFVNEKLIRFANPIFFLRHRINRLIETRKKYCLKRKDCMQALLDCESEDFDRSLDHKNISLSTDLPLKMSLEEIKRTLVLFVLTGYDSTSTALTSCIHVLANHAEEMKKLQEEIDMLYSNDAQPSFDNINSNNYMELFIKEVLRMYPLGNNVVNRRCTKECTIKGIKVHEGLVIAPDVLTLHYDPEYWGPVDPTKFYPLRFSPDKPRNNMAYLPFGVGPRNCVGERFCMIEMKLILTKILMKYDIVPTSSVVPLDQAEFVEGPTIRRLKSNFQVVFKRRNKPELPF